MVLAHFFAIFAIFLRILSFEMPKNRTVKPFF
nr:MAG TPA: hypothetical protein [Caudoviricetes sp.]